MIIQGLLKPLKEEEEIEQEESKELDLKQEGIVLEEYLIQTDYEAKDVTYLYL